MSRRLIWLTVYAIAMAYLESAVVVYLRAIYYPAGFTFPIVVIPDRMAAIEVGREAMTILMLLAVGILAGEDRWGRFLNFCFLFGVWDLFYYGWLRLFIGWPPSLLTWDILFLIPVPWIGPVLAPLLISASMIGGSFGLLALKGRGASISFAWPLWALAIAGGAVVLASFTLDYRVALVGDPPPPFRWGLFLTGLAMALSALLVGTRGLSSRGPSNPSAPP